MTNREAAIKVVKRLRSKGFEALLAGGCVRDMVLGRRAKDYDVVTNAHPDDVVRLFRRTLKVGVQFGVVIVLVQKLHVEVATFRTETGYVDGRHPGKVEFTDAAEDAARRDFTINGMFYDPVKRQVIDHVGGQADLKSKIVRTIGAAEERFGEDYLRMLRAVRFAAQLGFSIETRTWSAICRNAENITRISSERIRMELEGILVCPNRAAGVSSLIESGLAEAIFPAFVGREAKSAVKVMAQLREKVDFALALACLFTGFESDFAIGRCAVLKLSRNEARHVKFLLVNRGRLLDEQMPLSGLKMILSEPYFWDLYELQRAIQRTKGRGRKAISPLIKLRKRIKALGDVELRPKPLLNGHDLMRLGAASGPTLGQLAEEMYIAQLEGQLQTVRQAKQWVKEWLQKRRTVEG